MSWVLVASLVNVVVSVGVVWRVHARLRGAAAATPIGPGLAVLYLFLPLTNLLWLVVWPARAARQLGLGTGRGVACSGALVGGLTLEMLGAHGAVAVCTLVVAWALRGGEGGLQREEGALEVVLQTLWMVWVGAMAVTPPDLMTTLILALLATPIAVGLMLVAGRLMGGKTRWMRVSMSAVIAAATPALCFLAVLPLLSSP